MFLRRIWTCCSLACVLRARGRTCARANASQPVSIFSVNRHASCHLCDDPRMSRGRCTSSRAQHLLRCSVRLRLARPAAQQHPNHESNSAPPSLTLTDCATQGRKRAREECTDAARMRRSPNLISVTLLCVCVWQRVEIPPGALCVQHVALPRRVWLPSRLHKIFTGVKNAFF